jgi:hypothetical protein
MKFRVLFLALVTALLSASVALAGDHPGKGPKPRTGPGCRPAASIILRGTLANDPAAGDTSFQMNVTKANKHGRAYAKAAQPVTINVDAKTMIRRKVKGSAPTKTLESLAMGDRVHVHAKACKADLANGGTPQLTARHVKAKGAAPTPPPAP